MDILADLLKGNSTNYTHQSLQTKDNTTKYLKKKSL